MRLPLSQSEPTLTNQIVSALTQAQNMPQTSKPSMNVKDRILRIVFQEQVVKQYEVIQK